MATDRPVREEGRQGAEAPPGQARRRRRDAGRRPWRSRVSTGMDPRTPVLVGGGQLNLSETPIEPVDMIVAAVRKAAAAHVAPGLAEEVEAVRVEGMACWR